MKKEEVTRGIPKKKRKYNKKRIALLIIILAIIIGSIIAMVRVLTSGGENVVSEEEYVQLLEDGTKLNTSKKLSKEKQVEGLTVSNIQLTAKDDISMILADVSNHTKETKGGFAIEIQVIDGNGEVITTVLGYLAEIEPNETTQLNVQTTLDFANAYDIVIQKTEM